MSLKRQLLILFGSIGLLSVVHAATITTPETMVVSRSDDAETEATLDVDTVTEGPVQPIKLTKMDVKSVISMRYAHTAIVAHVRNAANKSQEANFRVLLPDTAFISGFVMTLDGKSYKAYVKEKKEAAQIYQTAVSQGIGAAHIAARARDSNHFTVSVNVEAFTKATFNLTYEELLEYRNGVYNHAVNLQPGQLVSDFTVTIDIRESNKITELRVPEIRTGNEIDATKDDEQISNAEITRCDNGAVILFKPDLDEQKRLMSVYAEKSKDSLRGNVEGVLGQFVVQYDVERPKDGEVLVNGGYFVHFFAPADLAPLRKYVVFVLDTSGSMYGRKIEQLKQAMQTILSELNPGDYFSILSFDSDVLVTDIADADKEPPKRKYSYYDRHDVKPTLKPASKATPENIARAKIIIDRLEANGGTNIDAALGTAIDLIRNRSELFANSTSSNKDEILSLEPIIIFLTDGDPTVGEMNPKTIIKNVAEKNYGSDEATIFSLAFGEDADPKLLRKLSLRNNGFARHIYEASDAALQLRDFYRQVSSPLLSHVKFVYAPDQVIESSVTKTKFRTYYAGSEVVVAGQVDTATRDLESTVEAFCGDENDHFLRKKITKKIKVPVPVEKSDLPLERLWAYLTIKQLLDASDASDATEEEKKKETSPEQQALKIALKYEFVTPLTSLVVVKPNETDAVNAEPVGDRESGQKYGLLSLTDSHRQPISSPAMYRPSLNAMSPLAFSAFPNRGYTAFNKRPVQALFSQDSMRVESEAVDDYDYEQRFGVDPPSTPVAYAPPAWSTTPVIEQSTTSNGSNYHLQEYPWAEPYVDVSSDSLVFVAANNTITLKLVSSSEPPKSESECSKPVSGDAGRCVYLTRCQAARNITIDTYKSHYCDVAGFAGVCCPQDSIAV
ncbi:inter-alpha-trypsin inhibitor heavy chain H4-like [Bombyx mandarina]|uniref:Inter-alpha-trypsin inhibitor heavy chain H4-like n=1 Tax=Bombyx mandarina TaxID=7092 RepID=A0A6J2KJ22_BOMMA|nr:inter-alpha-trypsin inhibitor heavy chain H4-like [Bombyx mandarina]